MISKKLKYNDFIDDWISSDKKLKESIKVFCIQNDINIEKITVSEVRELMKDFSPHASIDEKKIKNIIKQMK